MPSSDERIQRLFSEAQALVHVGIWELDAASGAVFWSDELFQILGLAPRDHVATMPALIERAHPEDRAAVEGCLARARRDRAPVTIECRLVRPSGELRVVQLRARAILDAGGSMAQLVGVVQDITETKQIEARVVFSDRMISLGTLAGGVAHEINNPLATIAAQLHLLDETYRNAGTRDATQAVERIRSIVRGLAAFSRADEDVHASIDLQHVLELAIGLASNEIRHRARLVREFGSLPYVAANEARLGHAFINLLVNAAEAIPEGHADQHEIRVVTRTDNNGWAIVEIRDTGVGIPPDVVDRIFDPFFTTKPVGQGTGLGLSICHGVVRSLGGEIGVTSEPGTGTTFAVAIPPSADAPRRRTTSENPAQIPGLRGQVLVVDDDVLFARSLRRLLETEHDVVVVHNGREALTHLRGETTFDVILCDLMMPEMTGAELHGELCNLDQRAADRVIFITGGAFSPVAQRFLDRIPNLCLEKPCNIAELRATVRRRVATSRKPSQSD